MQAERRAGLQRSLTSRRVRSFVHSWYAGKLKPYLRSAPAPESQPPGTVQLVVGSTFSRMVLDDESEPQRTSLALQSSGQSAAVEFTQMCCHHLHER